ncbi:MAG: rhomboid family intramembrane serine protease [Candidatus Polarisedimenticolia bacterium]
MIPLKDDNPSRTAPVVTVLLMAANVLAFLYQMSLGQEGMQALVYRLGLIPVEVTEGVSVGAAYVPVPLTFLTSMFLHGDLMHLLGNMLYLWIFGNNVEDELGHVLFLPFYVACGLAAAALQVFMMPGSEVPMIGASGAIAGVLGAYLILFPHARVLTLVPIFIIIRLMYLPAVVVLGIWFVFQLLMSADARTGGGVAFFAHIGGFVAGMALILMMRGPSAWRRSIHRPEPRGRAWRGDDDWA